MKIKLYIVFLFCLFYLSCHAQPLRTGSLTSRDGLSNNYITCMAQDKRGFVYIGTEAGLNRFDGYQFLAITTENSTLAGDAINHLTYDPQSDLLWIGTKMGLSVWNCSTMRMEKLPATPYITNGTRIFESMSLSRNHGLWLARQSGAVMFFDKKIWAFSELRLRGLSENANSILEARNGLLYIGHRRDGLSVYDPRRKTLKRYVHQDGNNNTIAGNKVYCIKEDSSGRIWLGTDKGLSLLMPGSGRIITYTKDHGRSNSLLSNTVYDLIIINNKLWTATDIGGISILDLNDKKSFNASTAEFRNITTGAVLSSPYIRSLMQDSYGNIWIGNYGLGLDFLGHYSSPFRPFPSVGGVNARMQNSVWGLFADGNTVWVGMQNGVAVLEAGRLVRHVPISAGGPNAFDNVLAMTRTGNEILLGLKNSGLMRLDARTYEVAEVPMDGGDRPEVYDFFNESNGDVLIATGRGVYKYSGGRAVKLNIQNAYLNYITIFSIARDRQGRLWLGTFGSGVHIIDRRLREVSMLSRANGFCSSVISQVFLDRRGRMWIATKNGLGYVKDTRRPGAFKCYTTANILANSYIHSVQEDLKGNIWLTSDNGVSCLNVATQEVDDYGFPDETEAVTMNARSSCMTADGTIFFGSLGGGFCFKPDDFTRRMNLPAVHISSCMEPGDESDYGLPALIPADKDKITLTHDHNSVRVAFAVPDYSLNGLVEYAYKLEGHDNKWINTHDDNTVLFRNLSPGSYTLRVKARLKNRPWDESHIATLKIRIEPPLWLTWYAFIFYILLAAGGVSLWFRFYKRRLELENSLELERRNAGNERKANNERMRFLTNITHELRTPLTLIIGPLEDLATDKDVPEPLHQRHLMIYNSAVRLLNLVNRLLDFRRTEAPQQKLNVSKGDLRELVSSIFMRFKELNKNQNVQFVINGDGSDLCFLFDSEVITTIMNNLLGNAVKYTKSGIISVNLKRRKVDGRPLADIEVKDTGYGIPADALPHIFERYYQAGGPNQKAGNGIGLSLVQSLVKLHDAEISVTSTEGKGSTFTVSLKMDNTYPDATHGFSAETENVHDTDGSKQTVLVVDDNAEIRSYIAESLCGDYVVIQAADGRQGLDVARKNLPDLIVSDVMMPDIDGIELCRQIKEDATTSHIPVILLTAKDAISDKEEGYQSGADSYLTKPFSARLLRIRIQNLLDSRHKLAAELARKLQDPGYNVQSTGLNKVDADFLATVSDIIMNNITDNSLDIPFIIDKIGMSHSTFYRKLKSLTGLSGNEFIRKMKIKHCVQLLQDGQNISEAAYASGFNDLSNFRASFKKEFGITPSEYVKKIRNA